MLLLVTSLVLDPSNCFTYDKKNVGETYKLDVSAISAYLYEVRYINSNTDID